MKKIVIAIVFVLLGIAGIAQEGKSTVSTRTIKKWTKEKSWANGLQLELHPTVNKEAFYSAYHTNQQLWDAAFEFLKTQNLEDMQPGKYPIIGEDVFATVSEAASHDSADVKWESHKKYIDLQYIIKGREVIGIADASKATITKPYTVDAMNYIADGKYYTTEPGKFFLFFPNDAHRPTIKAPGYDMVKKIVIKIRIL